MNPVPLGSPALMEEPSPSFYRTCGNDTTLDVHNIYKSIRPVLRSPNSVETGVVAYPFYYSSSAFGVISP